MTALTVGIILALMLSYGAAMAVVGPLLMELYAPSPGVAEAIRESVGGDFVGRAASAGGEGWWRGVLLVLTGRRILPVLVATLVLAVLARGLPPGPRGGLERRLRVLADAVLRVVRWILMLTPFGVFFIVLGMALRAGVGTVEVAVVYVVLLSGLMILGTLVLYPLTALVTRRPIADLVRGYAPPQLVAASTRSSVASLPAMVEAAEDDLRMPRGVAGFTLPLAVSIFKLNQAVLEMFRLFFLAHLFGVALGLLDVLSFFSVILLVSFGTVGLPRGGGAMHGLPAFLAAGIPIEGYLLTEALEEIPDIFSTVLNVTADMSVAAMVSGSEA